MQEASKCDMNWDLPVFADKPNENKDESSRKEMGNGKISISEVDGLAKSLVVEFTAEKGVKENKELELKGEVNQEMVQEPEEMPEEEKIVITEN